MRYNKKIRHKQNNKTSRKEIQTKRWLRKVVMQTTRYWSAFLRLDALADVITIYIAEANDESIGENSGACITVDNTRRSVDMRIKRNVVNLMDNEYPNIKDPEDVAEMTVLHELCHVLLNPMSDWVSNTISTMPDESKKILDTLFEQEEEQVVEHMTRFLYFASKLQEKVKPHKKFQGKIVYLAKDPEVHPEVHPTKPDNKTKEK